MQKKFYAIEDAYEKIFKQPIAELSEEESLYQKKLANVNTATTRYSKMLNDVLPSQANIKMSSINGLYSGSNCS